MERIVGYTEAIHIDGLSPVREVDSWTIRLEVLRREILVVHEAGHCLIPVKIAGMENDQTRWAEMKVQAKAPRDRL